MRRSNQTVLVRSLKNPLITRRMTAHSAHLNSTLWEPVPDHPMIYGEEIKVKITPPYLECNVVAIIPVNGRLPLVRQTIERLLIKNNIIRVICVVSSEDDAAFILDLTKTICCITVISHNNKPLGAKWNAGFLEARKYDPDACVFVGSSDWLSDNWVSSLLPLTDKYDMIGTPGCHLLDIREGKKFRLLNWGGYLGERSNESIGIGRILSARILNKIAWKPFVDDKDGSLDYAMSQKVKRAGGKIGMLAHPELISMAISTDQWGNKHRFEDHVSGVLRRNSLHIKDVKGFLNNNFPEAYQIFHENI